MMRIFNFILILTVAMLAAAPPVSAQDPSDEHEGAAQYQRPDYKVYKSLSAAMANPDSVFILELKGKKLKEIPNSVYKLPNLMVLDLKKNKIKSVPPEIGQLQNLVELDLTSNKLDSLPQELGELKLLKKLSLNRNRITSLPNTISKLQELQILELWDNEIATLPDEIRELRKLQVLELRGILFSDEQQQLFRDLLPDARIYMSPPCDCKTF